MRRNTWNKLTRSCCIILLLFMILGLSTAYIYIRESQAFTHELTSQLSLLSQVKAQSLERWFSAHISLGQLIMHDRLFTRSASTWFKTGSPQDRQALESRLQEYLQIYHLRSALLTGTDGIPLTGSMPDTPSVQLDSEELRTAFESNSPRVLIRSCTRCPLTHAILICPIVSELDEPLGAVLLEAVADEDLLTLFDYWPTSYGQTPETLITGREQRIRTGTEDYQPLQITPETDSALYRHITRESGGAMGDTVFMTGIDEHAVPVLIAQTPIDGTPWQLSVKIDQQEVLTHWHQRSALIIAASILIAAIVTAGVFILTYGEKRRYTRQLHAAQHALGESEQRYQELLENTPSGVFIIDEKGIIQDINSKAGSMTGYAKRELQDHHLRYIIPKEQYDCAQERLMQLQHTGHAVWDMQYRLKQGELRWGQWEFMHITRDLCIGYLQDITETKLYEQQQQVLEERLQQRSRLESVGRLAGGIAHDFNNYLQAILGYTLLIEDLIDPADTTCIEYLREVAHSAQLSAALTHQLLGFAREQDSSPQVIDLNTHIQNSLPLLSGLNGERIALQFIQYSHFTAIHMDPYQIDHILKCLIVNAGEAIDGNGTVIIALEAIHICRTTGFLKTGYYAQLQISDDGRGMDRELTDHIFEPFYSTKEEHLGAGMGLSSIYGIIQQNGGSIEVFSEPEKGTRVTIHIPLAVNT
jgi:PAS domain S-box-containing protein